MSENKSLAAMILAKQQPGAAKPASLNPINETKADEFTQPIAKICEGEIQPLEMDDDLPWETEEPLTGVLDALDRIAHQTGEKISEEFTKNKVAEKEAKPTPNKKPAPKKAPAKKAASKKPVTKAPAKKSTAAKPKATTKPSVKAKKAPAKKK